MITPKFVVPDVTAATILAVTLLALPAVLKQVVPHALQPILLAQDAPIVTIYLVVVAINVTPTA